MYRLVCDNCGKPILNKTVYYKVRQIANNNDMFRDEEHDYCPNCASELSMDGNLIKHIEIEEE